MNNCTQCNAQTETTEREDIEKYILIDFTGTRDPICDECSEHILHELRCPICYETSDYCQGHGTEEATEFGDCPICNLPHPKSLTDSLLYCEGHSLVEIREHQKETS